MKIADTFVSPAPTKQSVMKTTTILSKAVFGIIVVMTMTFASCSTCKYTSTYTSTTHNSMKYGHDGEKSLFNLDKSKTPYAPQKVRIHKTSNFNPYATQKVHTKHKSAPNRYATKPWKR